MWGEKGCGKCVEGDRKGNSTHHLRDIPVLPLPYPHITQSSVFGERLIRLLPAVSMDWVSSMVVKNCETGEKALGLMNQFRNRFNLSEVYVAFLCSCG